METPPVLKCCLRKTRTYLNILLQLPIMIFFFYTHYNLYDLFAQLVFLFLSFISGATTECPPLSVSLAM